MIFPFGGIIFHSALFVYLCILDIDNFKYRDTYGYNK